MRYLVDASVVVKWFVPEDLSDAADALLTGEHELCAPDFVLVEAASVFWKKVRSDQMTAAKADEALLALTMGASNFGPHHLCCRGRWRGRTASAIRYTTAYISLRPKLGPWF